METAFFTTGSGAPLVGAGGAVVAVLELAAPTTQALVLRGNFPVPKGTYPRADGLEPFAIRDWDGTLVPTQAEVVSRYPGDQDGADVVEVIGRVTVPPGTVADARLFYDVVDFPHDSGPLSLDSEVLELLTVPDKVLLVGRDCFGHEYRLDLCEKIVRAAGSTGDAALLREGRGAVTIRTHGVMKPTTNKLGEPTGALPHLFGAHAYVTTWASTGAVSLDLRVHNAFSGLNKTSSDDDPIGRAYFVSLELWVPKGWGVGTDVQDPFWGTVRNKGKWRAFEVVRPLANGELHVMDSQASFNRRLVLTRTGNELEGQALVDEEWLGFCRRGASPSGGELYSWWNDQTPAYFTQRHRMPDLSYLGGPAIESRLRSSYNQTKKVLESGNGTGFFPFEEDVLGWAHPWGVPYGGMASGSEIYLYDGFLVAEAADRRGYKHVQHTHRMYTSRQPDKLYDENGEPTNVESWVILGPQGKYVNMKYFQGLVPNSPDPFGLTTSPNYQRKHASSTGRVPAYEATLRSYDEIDFQHYVRYTRSPKVLTWLGNDPLAKDDLRSAAEIFRLSYHEHPVNANGATIVSGFLDDKQFVEVYPGIGFPFGRQESWGLDVALAAYSTADVAWRAQARPWFELIADTINMGQGYCNGIIQAGINSKWVGGNYRARQSIEQAITEHMIYGMVASVFADVDPARTAALDYTLGRSTEAMIGSMCWSTGANGGVGPHSAIAVGPLQYSQTPYCGLLPNGGYGNGIDRYQVWSSFAYGREKTGNLNFSRKASELAGLSGTLRQQMESMGFDNLENRFALIADQQ